MSVVIHLVSVVIHLVSVVIHFSCWILRKVVSVVIHLVCKDCVGLSLAAFVELVLIVQAEIVSEELSRCYKGPLVL